VVTAIRIMGVIETIAITAKHAANVSAQSGKDAARKKRGIAQETSDEGGSENAVIMGAITTGIEGVTTITTVRPHHLLAKRNTVHQAGVREAKNAPRMSASAAVRISGFLMASFA
jgi:hypothetical protein